MLKKIGYKLFRIRKDGTLGPLFINRKQRIVIGERLFAESHRTIGYAFRPGWHVCSSPSAPHLSLIGRTWYEVEIEDWQEHVRPANQGGLWFTANIMTVIKNVDLTKITINAPVV